MKKEVVLKVNPKFTKKYKAGYPLLFKEAIQNLNILDEEGQVVKLVDEKNSFIAKGYYGKQNKGYGWILSHKENESIDQTFFTNKIQKAIKLRNPFYQDAKTTAFRVFNGEGDGIGGLTIDYFDGYYLINWYSEGIYHYRDYIFSALKEVPGLKGVYQKKRFAQKGQYIDDDDFVLGSQPEFPIIVKENGVNMAVYLNESAMVGVFLDQREVRKAIRDHYANAKTVLNTFSYTGAFSVFAALGGAIKTTSVDLANRSLNKTTEQFEINGIDAKTQSIIVEDVFKYFKYAVRKELKFDLVILDPPSFARSKKHVFSAEKDYTNLLKEAIAITNDDGVVVASTNSASFGMNRFKEFIHTAFKDLGSNYEILEEYSLPSDFKTVKVFPEGDYLKVVFIKVKGSK